MCGPGYDLQMSFADGLKNLKSLVRDTGESSAERHERRKWMTRAEQVLAWQELGCNHGQCPLCHSCLLIRSPGIKDFQRRLRRAG